MRKVKHDLSLLCKILRNSLSLKIQHCCKVVIDLFCFTQYFACAVFRLTSMTAKPTEKAREICTRGAVLHYVSSPQHRPYLFLVDLVYNKHQAQVCNQYLISLLDSIPGRKLKNHSSVFTVNNLVLFFPRCSPPRLTTLTKLTCEKPTRRKMQTACSVTLKGRRMLTEQNLCMFHLFRLKLFSVFCQCSVVDQFKAFGCFKKIMSNVKYK